MKNLFFTFILLCGFKLMVAQDPHFSLMHSTPMSLNPAMTGLFNSSYQHRLATNYRNQWSNLAQRNVFQTFLTTYETKICPSGNDDRWGVGGSILYDRSGNYPLERGFLNLSFSYTRLIGSPRFMGNKDVFLAAGGEGGMILYQVNEDDLRYDEQFNGLEYDNSIPGERFDNYRSLMGDIGGGLFLFTAGNRLTETGFTIGVSSKHLNTPEYSFFNNDNDAEARLSRRSALHLSGTIEINRGNTALSPKALYLRQGAYQQLFFGSDLLMTLGKSNSLESPLVWMPGIALRRSLSLQEQWHNDALVFSVKTQAANFTIAMSYDLSLSKVRAISNNGALEILMLYHFKGKMQCPMPCPVY